MVVKVPRGSVNKYEYDPILGLFRLDRSLYNPMHFPGGYGFVPGTIADDVEPAASARGSPFACARQRMGLRSQGQSHWQRGGI